MSLDHLFSVMNTETLAKKSRPNIQKNSVILANNTHQQAANDPHPKGEIKPVLQVAAQSEPLNDGTDLSHQLETQVKNESCSPLEDGQLKFKSADKLTPENLGDALKTEPPSQIEEVPLVERKTSLIVERFTPMVKISTPKISGRYSHCVRCNQCEHLALTGTCKRLGKRVLPTVTRECDYFISLHS